MAEIRWTHDSDKKKDWNLGLWVTNIGFKLRSLVLRIKDAIPKGWYALLVLCSERTETCLKEIAILMKNVSTLMTNLSTVIAGV